MYAYMGCLPNFISRVSQAVQSMCGQVDKSLTVLQLPFCNLRIRSISKQVPYVRAAWATFGTAYIYFGLGRSIVAAPFQKQHLYTYVLISFKRSRLYKAELTVAVATKLLLLLLLLLPKGSYIIKPTNKVNNQYSIHKPKAKKSK